MVLEALADVLAYRVLSPRLTFWLTGYSHPGWDWTLPVPSSGLAMRLGGNPRVKPGAGSPGNSASPSEPGCQTCSLPGPSSPTSLQSEAHTTETPRQGGGHNPRQPPSCLPVASGYWHGVVFLLSGDACLVSTLSPGGTHSGMGLEAWAASRFLACVSFPLEH